MLRAAQPKGPSVAMCTASGNRLSSIRSQGFVRAHRQINARVTWAGAVFELAWVQHRHFNAQGPQSLHQLMQGGHDPIDLGVPGIGDQRQLQAGTACAGKALTTTA
jgi:hypothetical protein